MNRTIYTARGVVYAGIQLGNAAFGDTREERDDEVTAISPDPATVAGGMRRP